ncbi:MAG: hypothetical protein H0X36_14735 [Sphingomonadaceae bacterium]|nr:hypothetical protein [Sphingomonadaceae bacterium]
MRSTRDVADRQLRRARLLAAQTRAAGSINRRGVLCGDWDRGAVVRAWMDDKSKIEPPNDKETGNERI